MKRQRFAWVTILPTAWLLICTVTAGLQKLFHPNPSIGFIAHAQVFGSALASGKILAPAKSAAEMQKIFFNDCVDATLAALFVAIVLAMLVYGLVSIRKALSNPVVTAVEVGAEGFTPGGAHA
jgi:carbon starvation protein